MLGAFKTYSQLATLLAILSQGATAAMINFDIT